MASSPFLRWLPAVLCLGLASCQAYRTRNDGQHLTDTKKHSEPSKKIRTLQAEVTTNPDGSVANIRLVRSSGAPGMDDFVMESIRSTWPATPSQRTVVEVSHSAANGFTEPKVISSTPVQ